MVKATAPTTTAASEPPFQTTTAPAPSPGSGPAFWRRAEGCLLAVRSAACKP
jgi:hypothetical protein